MEYYERNRSLAIEQPIIWQHLKLYHLQIPKKLLLNSFCATTQVFLSNMEIPQGGHASFNLFFKKTLGLMGNRQKTILDVQNTLNYKGITIL